jgi:hypothetical protein
MARFADYLDYDYLPGDVRRSSYGDASPSAILNYETRKLFKFKPDTDMAGKYMKEFAGLSGDPANLFNAGVRLPGDFTGMMNFLGANQ